MFGASGENLPNSFQYLECHTSASQSRGWNSADSSEYQVHDYVLSNKPVNSIPKNFGRYRIERALGQGGMGAVYLAHDAQLDRKVAIKTPKFTEKSSQILMKRFYREARSAATLQHPNICPIYDVGEIDDIHYISMAYIEGRPLSDSMRSKSFPPVANIIRVVRKVALALHEAHAQGLVHRDLKPANIMIDQRGEPIVMDFGLARQFGSEDNDDLANVEAFDFGENSTRKVEARLTMEGTIVGSPGYMSPEQLYGHRDKIGPPSDVYALGVLLFELLTRQLPFPGDGTLMSIVNAVISDPTPNAATVRSEIEPKFAAICQKAMAKKIEDRYESMQSFAVALTGALKASGDENSTGKIKDNSNTPTSPELVRTKEQYELARSLFQEEQFAAAATIMEKMVAGAGASSNQYAEWAQNKLVKAREKAVEALTSNDSVDDLWGDETRASTPPVRRRRSRSGFRRRWLRLKKQSGLPSWAYRLATVSVGVIVLLLVAALLKYLILRFGSVDSFQPPATESTSIDTQALASDTESNDGVSDPQSSSEPAPPDIVPNIAGRLARFDSNEDGKISRVELEDGKAPTGGPLRRIIDSFEQFDIAPRDGVLSREEVEVIAERLRTRNGRPNRR